MGSVGRGRCHQIGLHPLDSFASLDPRPKGHETPLYLATPMAGSSHRVAIHPLLGTGRAMIRCPVPYKEWWDEAVHEDCIPPILVLCGGAEVQRQRAVRILLRVYDC